MEQKNLEMIEQSRKEIHEMIDRKYDEFLERLSNGESLSDLMEEQPRVMSLANMPALFKGKKVDAVIFSDGRTVPVHTWKGAVTEILRDCNQNEAMHNRMLKLCDIVAGRQRIILGSNPNEMDVPLKIAEGIYFEGKFDTEYLIKMMRERVLKEVGYDYVNVSLSIREPHQQSEETEICGDEITEESAPVMQM